MDTDRKLAITVAAVVGVGVASILGLSLMPHEEPGGGAVTSARASQSLSPIVAPASVPVSRPATDPVPVSAGTPAEAEELAIEPGVNYLARGVEKYKGREFDHAAAYLLAEIESRPERPYSHYLLGLALWKAGRLDESVDAMNRSAELDPAAIRTFVNLSRIQNDRGEYDAALEAASTAVDLDAGDAGALFLAGRSLHNLGEHEQASEHLTRSLEADPDNGYVWNLLGLTLLARGQDLDALEAFRAAASLEDEAAYIHNNLGMALELNGYTEEAVVAYGRAVEVDPGHDRAALNRARLQPLVPEVPERDATGVAAVVAVPAVNDPQPALQPETRSEPESNPGSSLDDDR